MNQLYAMLKFIFKTILMHWINPVYWVKAIFHKEKKGEGVMKHLLIVLLVIMFLGCTTDNFTAKRETPLIKHKLITDIEIVKTDFGRSPAGFPQVILTVKNKSAYTMWNLHCYFKVIGKNDVIMDTATIYFASGSDIKSTQSVIGEGNFFKLEKSSGLIENFNYEFGYNFR